MLWPVIQFLAIKKQVIPFVIPQCGPGMLKTQWKRLKSFHKPTLCLTVFWGKPGGKLFLKKMKRAFNKKYITSCKLYLVNHLSPDFGKNTYCFLVASCKNMHSKKDLPVFVAKQVSQIVSICFGVICSS